MATIAGGIILFGGVVVALNAIVLKFFRPLFHAAVTVRDFTETIPTLTKIAEEFQPNSGKTLRDQVDGINFRLGNIEGQLEALVTNSHPSTEHHGVSVAPAMPVTFDLPSTGSA